MILCMFGTAGRSTSAAKTALIKSASLLVWRARSVRLPTPRCVRSGMHVRRSARALGARRWCACAAGSVCVALCVRAAAAAVRSAVWVYLHTERSQQPLCLRQCLFPLHTIAIVKWIGPNWPTKSHENGPILVLRFPPIYSSLRSLPFAPRRVSASVLALLLFPATDEMHGPVVTSCYSDTTVPRARGHPIHFALCAY